MSDAKMTAEESCRQVLKTIADACDQESLARADGYLFRYVQEETLESPPRIAGKTAGFDPPGREHTAGDALGLRRNR